MHLAGADEIYVLGGVQALAALAIGTETIPRVSMLVGPGNAYVAEAKRQLFGDVGIDLLAGPTEILVVADESTDPRIAAADLIGQAEHGPASPAVLITTSHDVAEQVEAEIERQLAADLSTAETASKAWVEHGAIHVVESAEHAIAKADELAYEHVEILTTEPRFYLERMTNYGTLFLGEGTTVAYGDKTIGTNHVLPTSGAARYNRRPLGGEIPEDGDPSGGARAGLERDGGRDLRAAMSGGGLRGARPQAATCESRSSARSRPPSADASLRRAGRNTRRRQPAPDGASVGRARSAWSSRERRCRVIARSGDQLLEVVGEIEKIGGRARARPADVAVEAELEAALSEAWGDAPVDVLVTAAGLNRTGPSEDYATADFDLLMDVNVRGTFLAARGSVNG